MSVVVIIHNTEEKANLQKMKVNTMKIRKVHMDGNNIHILGKNMEAIYPVASLGGTYVCQLLCSGRQANKILTVYKKLKICNLNSKAHLGCLNSANGIICNHIVS